MICFYFMLGGTIFFIKQIATVTVLPAAYRKAEFLQVGAMIGIAIGVLLSYFLPMYALNRILLAQSQTQIRSN